MDSTSSSVTTSPEPPQQTFFDSPPSPPETSCPSEGSITDYPSPALLAHKYFVPSAYSSIGSCSLSQTLPELETAVPPLNTMSQATWVTPDDVVVPSTPRSSSAVANSLSVNYDAFATYETCLSNSFSDHQPYPPPPPSHSLLSQTPQPLAGSPMRTSSIGSRPSFGYAQELSDSKMKVETSAQYGSGFDESHYPASGSRNMPYSAVGSAFPSNLQPYLGQSPAPTWSKQEHDASQLYGSPQPQTSDSGQDRRSMKVPKARRPARKHTTKEEANFQCEVKGCGKFFSRSYNYKSHLETHDDQREYPFPCPIDGCCKRFVRKTDLQRHNQSVHMKERNHKCDYCGRLFARKDTLRRHMEDGCSKRFDIGTLDLRSDNYSGMEQGDYTERSNFQHLPSTSGTLPPMSMESGQPMLRPRAVGTGDVESSHEHHQWHR
ncbi:hypothetical protein G7046_g3436 [Stylonectria norvegica]|nr:hypothetical protein G7046_g3436 [Stylonectria norvegica]